jgi:hypothetical protein
MSLWVDKVSDGQHPVVRPIVRADADSRDMVSS